MSGIKFSFSKPIASTSGKKNIFDQPSAVATTAAPNQDLVLNSCGRPVPRPVKSSKPSTMWKPGDAESDTDDDAPSAGLGLGFSATPSTSNDDVDYMADSFVPKSETAPKPVKVIAQPKSVGKQQEERLEEGLATHIEEDNKGFAMLAKMGYKKGMGLGREGQGIVEPVGVDKRSGREGVGILTKGAEKKVEERKRTATVASLQDQFHEIQRKKQDTRKVESRLRRAVKVCTQLDERLGLDNNTLLLATGAADLDPDEAAAVADMETVDEKAERLISLVEYMRHRHLYCVWCAAHYDSIEQLEDLCPGLDEDDH
eukprot:TRINITY_DN3050_c0_g1_i1.p1 TRINITY_DN3050_c0_g1~~TRINITY_DN3050_c0_g1_i1.p1  ORF type:complete len:314 (-),score=66.57 TRINITY_DN3050_c0_g1_i1:770-1711(-)